LCDPVSVISGAAGLAGQSAQAQASSGAAREQARLNRAALDWEKEKFNRLFSTGRSDLAAGESALMAETARAPEELRRLKMDIASQGTEAQQEAAKQANLALAQQGISGPQAALIRGRSAGGLAKGMGQDLTRLAYEDVLSRRGIRTGFQGAKALAGQGMGR